MYRSILLEIYFIIASTIYPYTILLQIIKSISPKASVEHLLVQRAIFFLLNLLFLQFYQP